MNDEEEDGIFLLEERLSVTNGCGTFGNCPYLFVLNSLGNPPLFTSDAAY